MRFSVIAILVLVLGLPALAASERYVQITAGDVTSGLFDLAGAVASAVSGPEGAHGCQTGQPCADMGLRAMAQTSVSATSALAKLRAGAVDAAVVPDTLAYATFNGSSDRRASAWPQLRSLANLAIRPMIVVVRGDSSANSLGALKGWHIATGPRNSDAQASIAAMLTAMGLPASLYRPVATPMDASALDLISTNKADAVILLAEDLPAPERAALADGRLRLVSPAKGEVERALKVYPFLGRRSITPTGIDTYATICIGSVLVARDDLPADVVKTMLTRLWLGDTSQTSRIARGAGALLNPASAAFNLPAPLHTSAASFYQDNKMTESSHASP